MALDLGVNEGTSIEGSHPHPPIGPTTALGTRRDGGREIPAAGRSRWLWPVLAAALVARLAVIVPGFGTLSDIDNYLPLARSLAEGRGFALPDVGPTAYRPPLYPIILAPMVALLGDGLPWGIAALHVGLGLGTVGLTDLAGRRWGYSPARAAIAASIVALDPVAVVQGRAVMTETLAAFLVALGLAAMTVRGRVGCVLAGSISGLAALCRPSLLPGAGLAAGAILAIGPGDRRRRAVGCLLFVAGLVATMAPWAARNARAFGRPVWTTTHGGYTLALANNPEYYADVVDGPPGAVWSGANQRAWAVRITRETAGLSQVEADRALRDQGLRMLRDRPSTFLRASVARLGRFWGVAPSSAVFPGPVRLATALWTIPLWAALALGLIRRDLWRWPAVAAPLALLGLSAVHSAYWTDLRMRVPAVAAIGLIAAGASAGRRPPADPVRTSQALCDDPPQC